MLWPRCHSAPLGIVGLVANFQGMSQIDALGPWRAPQLVLGGSLP